MILSARYSITSGAMLGPIYPSSRDIRVSVSSAGIARLYASATPPRTVAADAEAGEITAAKLSARTVPRSNWLELGALAAQVLDGWAAFVVVAESGAAIVDLSSWRRDDAAQIRSGKVTASISTGQITTWDAGSLMAMPMAALPVEGITPSAPGTTAVTTSWLDGTFTASKGAKQYGGLSIMVPDTTGPHADAIALALFADAEFLLRLDTKTPGGSIDQSDLFAIKISSRSGATTILDGLRVYETQAIITRPPLRIINGE